MLLGEDFDKRRLIPAVCIFGVVEKCQHLEVFVLSDWVIFVGVALCACHCRSHPSLHRSVYPVYNSHITELLIIGAAFVIGEGISMEGSRDELIVVGVFEEVSRKLFDGELIKRHVAIDCPYYPVTVGPDCPWRIIRITR